MRKRRPSSIIILYVKRKTTAFPKTPKLVDNKKGGHLPERRDFCPYRPCLVRCCQKFVAR